MPACSSPQRPIPSGLSPTVSLSALPTEKPRSTSPPTPSPAPSCPCSTPTSPPRPTRTTSTKKKSPYAASMTSSPPSIPLAASSSSSTSRATNPTSSPEPLHILDRTLAVQLEMSLLPLYEGEVLMPQIYTGMCAKGFDLWDVEPNFRDPATGRLLEFDGIFTRRSVDPSTNPTL